MLIPDARTALTCVLGHPISHTLSPLIHNTAFAAQELNFSYLAFDVPPARLDEAISGLRSLGFAGANVTMPHKQAVRLLMDRLTPAAEAVGAVNTIVRVSREENNYDLVGDNTDVAGFLAPLGRYFGVLKGGRAVVFGAGGAARAVVYALLSEFQPAQIVVVSRRIERGQKLVSDLSAWAHGISFRAMDISECAEVVDAANLIVNCTPVGMAPDSGASIWQDRNAIHEGQIWYDLIYNPLETTFIRMAADNHASTISGLEMLIAQAAASYKQWTKIDMPVDLVRARVTEWFGSSSDESSNR